MKAKILIIHIGPTCIHIVELKRRSIHFVKMGISEKQASVQKEESLLAIEAGGFLTLIKRGRLPTLPLDAVPSAWTGLTSLFGMGRGGTPSP